MISPHTPESSGGCLFLPQTVKSDLGPRIHGGRTASQNEELANGGPENGGVAAHRADGPKGAPLPGDAVDADAYAAVSPKGKQRRSSPSFPCGLKQCELLGGDGDGPTFRQGDVIGIIPRGRQQDQILSLGHGRLKNQLQ